MAGFLFMRKCESTSQTESRAVASDDARTENLAEEFGNLDVGQLVLLRAFFSILDEWESRGKNVN